MSTEVLEQQPAVERAQMEIDIACVGFGPAMGGFLTTLSRKLMNEEGTPHLESATMPGMPLQVICYERADGLGFGVSGVVTKARGIKKTFPGLAASGVPMAVPVAKEKLVYLLDPLKASRRSLALRLTDKAVGLLAKNHAYEMPYIPSFMNKHGGMVMSIGQFNQWVGEQLMASGTVQIWPGTPVSAPLFDKAGVSGVRLADQGTDANGNPDAGFTPGMDIKAALTVIGDGPVGAVSRQIDAKLGLPDGNKIREWALGMKFVIELRDGVDLEPGTVFHTIGFPEPEIFGFMYVHPDRLVSIGIFVPSWFKSPVRTAYRYLQHYIQHPYLWKWLEGGTLKSWGAKSLQESGRHGEPFLAGNGFARIGEGSGSTNVLAGSGVDEAWTTGTLLAEAVVELAEKKLPFTRENLESTYVQLRRASWLETESRIAANSRNGFQRGVVTGMIGMALAGFTRGRFSLHADPLPLYKATSPLPELYSHIPRTELERMKAECAAAGSSLRDSIMDRLGWPQIQLDGKLLISHQDALLMGGGVQAPPGYANHVVFKEPDLCADCEPKLCVEMCSGQAITRGEHGLPNFDREKCVYCGACLWNCRRSPNGEATNIEFRAGAGGLHSAMN